MKHASGESEKSKMDCHFSVWAVLAFLSLSLVVSLILNISHYMKKKKATQSHSLKTNQQNMYKVTDLVLAKSLF
uniref:Uncharacterized protein n=1 Tax=Otus sunia TaxID=257818 RepID=A0A8C8E8V4_9STRI